MDKQYVVLETIQQFAVTRGMTPTLSEISEITGYAQSTVWSCINNLVKEKLLHKRKGKCRSITIAGWSYTRVEESGKCS